MKIFVADNLAKIVDPVFASSAPYNGVQVLVALYAFAFQIYCDFAGYSNIAIGLGRCMGFDIMVNFNLPYFVTNPREFWQRWHISLSTWLRDYLYIPLGGNRKGVLDTYKNIAITMLLGGLWHGAAWTFVIWGAYQGSLLIIYSMLRPILVKIPSSTDIIIEKVWFFIRALLFFHLVCLGWLIFRSQSLQQIFNMLWALIFNFNIASGFSIGSYVFDMIFFISFLFAIEFAQFIKHDSLIVYKTNVLFKSAIYVILFYLMVNYGVLYGTGGKEFIYFQF